MDRFFGGAWDRFFGGGICGRGMVGGGGQAATSVPQFEQTALLSGTGCRHFWQIFMALYPWG